MMKYALPGTSPAFCTTSGLVVSELAAPAMPICGARGNPPIAVPVARWRESERRPDQRRRFFFFLTFCPDGHRIGSSSVLAGGVSAGKACSAQVGWISIAGEGGADIVADDSADVGGCEISGTGDAIARGDVASRTGFEVRLGRVRLANAGHAILNRADGAIEDVPNDAGSRRAKQQALNVDAVLAWDQPAPSNRFASHSLPKSCHPKSPSSPEKGSSGVPECR